MNRIARRAVFFVCLVAAISTVSLLLRAVAPQAPNTWVATGDMSVARAGAASALLPDGRVLVTGGVSGAAVTSSSELYALGGGFSGGPSMQVERANHTATLLADGRVLVAGGADTGGNVTSSAEIYDGSGWSTVGSMSQARRGHTATLLPDGRVLIAGGDNGGAASETLELFDPSSGAFSAVEGVMSAPRTQHAAAAISEGRVLIAGGSDGNGSLASTDIYDAASGTVSAGPSLSAGRSGLSATTLLDGRVLLAGGAGAGAGSELSTADIFDPSSGAMGGATNGLTVARQGHLAILLPHNNQVLIVGGTNGGNPVATSEYFTPWDSTVGAFCGTPTCASGYVGPAAGAARAWAAGSALSFAASASNRSGAADGFALVAGGTGLQSSELFGFATIHTDKDDYAPGETVHITGRGWNPGDEVSLILTESPLTGVAATLDPVTADENGNISSDQFAPNIEDLFVRFYLTASGGESQAQTTFTDAAKDLTSISVSTQSPSAVPSTSIGPHAQFTVAGNFTGGSGTCSASLSVSGLPSGASGSFSPTSVTSAPATSTLTIQTAAVAAGTYSFTVTANATTGGGCATTLSRTANGSLVVFGAADHLTFSVQPTNTVSAAAINGVGGIKVEIRDALNTLVSNDTRSVTLSISTNPGSGTLSGTATASAAGGIATFTGLSINKAGTGYTLAAASSPSLTGATSSSFNITAGTATHLAFTGQPSNAQAGASISPPVTVEVRDNAENVVTTGADSTMNIAIAIGNNAGPGGVLSGTTPKSAVAGIATFSNLSIDKAGSGYSLTANRQPVGGITGATSADFNITAGAAHHLAFGQQPTDTIAKTTITPAVTVRVEDQFNNLVTGSSASISMAITTGSGTLSGTNPQLASGGIATFSDLSIDAISSPNHKLTASSSGLVAAESVNFKILRRPTTTTVVCVPSSVNVNTSTTCTATVTDTTTQGEGAPTGNVNFSTSGTGTFAPVTGQCTLGSPTTNSSSCSVTYTPTALGTGTHSIGATYPNSNSPWDGSNATAFGLIVTANVAPAIAAANASVTVNEGQTANNNGTWSDGNPGDTVTLTASVGTVIKAGTNAAGTWTWSFATTDGPDENQTVTITANDGNGGITQTTFSLTVNNVAPAVTFNTGLDTTVNESTVTEHTYSYTIVDPGVDTVQSVTTSCGALGTKVSGSDTFNNTAGSFKCVFPDGPAAPTVSSVTANATDSDSATGTNATLSVTVSNVAPIVTAGFASSGLSCGTAATLNISFTDPGADTWTYTVNWGDSSSAGPTATAVKSFNLSHTYALAGVYNATVTITDDDTGSGTDGTNSFTLNYTIVGGGVLQPMNQVSLPTDPSVSLFKFKSTVPVKIQVLNCDGSSPSDLTPQISIQQMTGNTPTGTDEGIFSTSAADTGTTMRFTGVPDLQYIFNLATKSLADSSAEYQLKITIPSTNQTVITYFGLKP